LDGQKPHNNIAFCMYSMLTRDKNDALINNSQQTQQNVLTDSPVNYKSLYH